MNRRVLLAGLFHETHTFLEGTTGLADFEVRLGDELLASAGDASPLGGVLEAAKGFGWTILPTADFRASPSATVTDEVVETFWREFRQRAEPELARGVDGIYLVLHGAMVSESLPDVEDELRGPASETRLSRRPSSDDHGAERDLHALGRVRPTLRRRSGELSSWAWDASRAR